MAMVLVVDDEPDYRFLLRMLLRDHDVELVEAANGQAALEVIEHHLPDVVITDLRMPVMDGPELVERLRAEERTREVRDPRLERRPGPKPGRGRDRPQALRRGRARAPGHPTAGGLNGPRANRHRRARRDPGRRACPPGRSPCSPARRAPARRSSPSSWPSRPPPTSALRCTTRPCPSRTRRCGATCRRWTSTTRPSSTGRCGSCTSPSCCRAPPTTTAGSRRFFDEVLHAAFDQLPVHDRGRLVQVAAPLRHRRPDARGRVRPGLEGVAHRRAAAAGRRVHPGGDPRRPRVRRRRRDPRGQPRHRRARRPALPAGAQAARQRVADGQARLPDHRPRLRAVPAARVAGAPAARHRRGAPRLRQRACSTA